MWKQPCNSVGWSNGLMEFQNIVVQRDCWGIRIGADSEIDQCYISLDGTELKLPQHALDTAVVVQVMHDQASASTGAIKVSTAHPWMGFVPAGAMITVYSSRAVTPSLFRLVLEMAESPTEAQAPFLGRAPLDINLSLNLATVGVARDFYIPTYGRRYMSITPGASAGGGITSIAWTATGIRVVWDTVNLILAQIGPVALVTGGSVSTVSNGVPYEGSGEYDMIKLSLTPTGGAGTITALFHIRAED